MRKFPYLSFTNKKRTYIIENKEMINVRTGYEENKNTNKKSSIHCTNSVFGTDPLGDYENEAVPYGIDPFRQIPPCNSFHIRYSNIHFHDNRILHQIDQDW